MIDEDEAYAVQLAEREACIREIFDYADITLAPYVGAIYRDAARLLFRGYPEIRARIENTP